MNHPLLQKASIVLTPTAYGTSTLNCIKPSNVEVENSVTSFANGTTFALTTFTSSSNNVTSGIVSSAFGGCVSNGISLKSQQKVRVRFDYTQNSGDELRVLFSSVVTGAGSLISDLTTINATGKFDHTFTITSNTTGYLQLGTGNSGHSINFSALNVTAEILPTANFDFTRNTTATRVNESGLIETVAVHTPRIDYLSGVGVILCEGTSTNTATYSNDFTQGDIFNGSGNPNANNSVITANSITAPDGTNNGWKLTDNNDGATGVVQLAYFSTNVTSGHSNTFSVFLKKGSTDFCYLSTGGFDSTANGASYFNLSTGAISFANSKHNDVKMEDYGNGWYRCSVSNRTTTDVVGSFIVGIATSSGSLNITRDGSNFLYMFGVQAEANDDTDLDSFLTSYIPTSGATATRNKDEVENGGNADLINSTEGVFYLNLAGLYRKFKSTRRISLSDGGSGDNEIRFDFTSVEDKITMRIRVGGVNVATKSLTGTVGDISQFRKYAIQWKENDFKFYVDGTEVHSDTSGATYSANTLDRLNFSTSAGGSHIEAKVKCIALFKETLTDAELVTLTT